MSERKEAYRDWMFSTRTDDTIPGAFLAGWDAALRSKAVWGLVDCLRCLVTADVVWAWDHSQTPEQNYNRVRLELCQLGRKALTRFEEEQVVP